MLDHSEACAVIVEDADQLEKIRKIRGDLPRLEHVISMEKLDGDDVISFDELRETRPLQVRRGLQEPHRIGGGVRRRHLHLHLRHDRPSEGLHHRSPELARHARHGRGAERARGAGGRLSVPAAGARIRAADPARLDRRRRDDRLLGARPGEDHPEPDGGQAHVLPLRPAHVREDLLDGRLGRTRQGAARAGDQARHEGAPDAGARRGGPGRAASRVRPGRPGAVPERAQPVRRADQAGRHRCGPDRPGDPRVLLRQRRPGARGLGNDRDVHRGDVQHDGRPTASVRSASPSPAWS